MGARIVKATPKNATAPEVSADHLPETVRQAFENLGRELDRVVSAASRNPSTRNLLELQDAVRSRHTAYLALSNLSKAHHDTISAMLENLRA